VIFKEGLTVRGLTTAASIWITATLGILYGVGFYYPAIFGTLVTVGVLAAFRWLERLVPVQIFFRFRVRYSKDKVPTLSDLLTLLKGHGFEVSAVSYNLVSGGDMFEYETMIRSNRRRAAQDLSADLLQHSDIVEFSVLPSGD
jgi:putative Mg2+ transporter-C (MgtC) family protein